MGGPHAATDRVEFVTCIRSGPDVPLARLLIESLREFGGPMGDCAFRVYATRPEVETGEALVGPGVAVEPLDVPEPVRRWPYGDKVAACARAEATVRPGIRTLVWLDLECLVVQPPVLFALQGDMAVAIRPVHIRNIGLAHDEPLNRFWHGIYRSVGIQDTSLTVESFVGGERLRAYYNSHGLSVDPRLGLWRRWHELFTSLIADEAFVRDACTDIRHPIFLFQAVFSALVAAGVPEDRIRVLPPTYNYPYNLHAQVPGARRSCALNDLVCFTFEERSLQPDVISDIEVREPLRSWLSDRTATAPR